MNRLKKWFKELLIMFVLLIIVSLAIDYWRQPNQDFTPQMDSMMLLQDSKEIALSALSEERPLLIYFWASWCSICKMTTPTVVDMAKEGDNVLAIVIRSGDDNRLTKIMGDRLAYLPMVNDWNGQISTDWGINAIPTFVILYKGKITYSTTGWSSYVGLWVRMKLAALLD